MQRRRVLAGLGGVAAASVAVGTGAFTRLTGERDATLVVTSDPDGYLGLEPLDPAEHPNADFALRRGASNLLALDFDEAGGGSASDRGFGPNPHGSFTFDDVFAVTNTGSQPTYLWFEPDDPEDVVVYDEFGFYVTNADEPLDGERYAAALGVGERAAVGVAIDTAMLADDGSDERVDVTVRADESNPADTAVGE